MVHNRAEVLNSGCPYQDLYIYYLQGRLNMGTRLSGPDFIGNWEEDEFCFLFYHQPSDKKVEDLLLSQPQLKLLDQFCMTYDEWQGNAPEPIEVGDFYISPPWMKPGIREKHGSDKIQMILDPGVVFGTGTHATTRDCLNALEMVCMTDPPETVLDLGTGTGVLALAASKLGCRKVMAVDINFLAAHTANHNIHLNHMENNILAVQGRAEDFIDCPFDLIMTNIHFDIMKPLIRNRGFLTKKWFILSGLMRSQAREIEDHLRQMPVKILRKWNRDGVWHTFFGKSEAVSKQNNLCEPGINKPL